MRIVKYITLTLLLTVTFATGAEAKRTKTDHMYMFGFSASFKDSTVYITDIQDVQGAWFDTKTKFLLGLDSYSSQMHTYLTEKMQLKHRVCMVYFAPTRKKAEKLYEKLKKKYVVKGQAYYNVQYVKEQDFKFEAIDMSEE